MTPYATPAAAPPPARLSVPALSVMAREGAKIAMLTAYDASFAAVAERAGVDVLLVGDSLGMVIQGHASTLPVTLADVVYHTRSVAAGCRRPLIISDLPFGSYQESPAQAYAASVTALQAGAQMVKLEGGAWLAPTVEFLTARGVPVRAGASLLVLECVPRAVGDAVTRAAGAPVIGIGAGPGCSGQVLVMYDALGIQPGRAARFVRNFMPGAGSIETALAAYAAAVKDGSFPGPEHCF